MPSTSSPAAVAPRTRVQRWLRHELPQLLLFLGLIVAARSSLANHYVVPSGSMQHTLEVGDRVVVDMRAYGVRLPLLGTPLWATGHPQRGEVAVFDSPSDGTRLIKRIAAVAGDRVVLQDGHLSINGRTLAAGAHTESFGARQALLDLDRGGGPDIAALTIPAGKVLVLGDHRGNSADGRYFGLVESADIYGRAVGVYYRRGEGLGWHRL
ncbi:MAG: signal peptidase I [Pseudoxanthomonas sp.]